MAKIGCFLYHHPHSANTEWKKVQVKSFFKKSRMDLIVLAIIHSNAIYGQIHFLWYFFFFKKRNKKTFFFSLIQEESN
jgi:hypothetical protein